ncbi:Calcineurin-binding protein cabin-1 [Pseudolycoriella hygida]|uniref:Calcineurin-binding protein cabin-1 n=1 Tax=Pseudolycoriella hygida TaxID=35572 RepID=A0A9Q0N9R3_9DIPT|nr:Calcineurin-binding protein cabin-1 [Pseudolycoriella hygida]
MMRIFALNEESRSTGSEDEDEPTVTKEAQETIAVSEFVRALQLKNNNSIDDACSLLRELLETEVLYNVSHEKKDKLLSVKYNCYKNLGFIYIEQGDSETALNYLLNAYELDDTDVFTMNKLGRLALQMNKPEIAITVFEKCLAQNPNHWPSLEGVLKVLCMKENYCEAYGWALLCYDKDKNYKYALNVILEVRSKFQNMGLEYIESCFTTKFTDFHLNRTTTTSVFPTYVEPMESEDIRPNFFGFKLREQTWLSFGELIVDLYKAIEDNDWGKHTIMTLSDLTCNGSVGSVEKGAINSELQRDSGSENAANNAERSHVSPAPVENNSDEDKEYSDSNEAVKCSFDLQQILSADGSADDSDATKQNEINGKVKQSRRRGSDLKFLEQWGWHKTKKQPVQRRKNVEQNDAETSINGILKRIFVKHFELNFDHEPILPVEDVDSNVFTSTEDDQIPEQLEISNSDFQIATQSVFDEFMGEIENSNFNIIILLAKWLKYVSRFWRQIIPKNLLDIYLKLYALYLNHHDLCTWNLLDKNDFYAAFRMALFYLELFYDKFMLNHNGKTEVDVQWLALYNHLIFLSGFFEVTCDEDKIVYIENRIRVFWLQYCLGKYEGDLQKAVDCLYSIDEVIQQQPEKYQIMLPNLKQNKKIDLVTCNELEKTLERTISLNSVNKLYHENDFDQLISILKDTIVTQAIQKTSDYDSPIRLSTQIEVFLEALWKIESYEECLIWSEKFLKLSVDNYLAAPSDTFRQTEWGDMVSYVLTYIEALIKEESVEILLCLEKMCSRLIQSLSKIVVNQLDVSYDKNGSRTHPVSTKLPWIILYHILQREEDCCPVQKYVADGREDDEAEDVIPNSLMIFFTAHDFLGRHRLCTNHNGGLLLFTLDVVAPRLRAPSMEPFRDIISEYLEQVTYCLYGYPSKKARSRHIGRHDAINVELDWQRGIQLFDIYRPDNLPEFNSFKNESISSEHEQLLQRIVSLVPSDIDPTGHVEGIRNFIAGTEKQLPQPFRLLPHRVHCIYYLLADYYFKYRDMVRSTKYYLLDLAICPTRFDSWAGLALSKASILEVKLNSCSAFCHDFHFSAKEFVSESEETLRCFQQCFELKKRHVLLWIEYGNFAYIVHSFYSRNLKLSSATLSMERFAAMEMKKDECLQAACKSFNTVEEFVHRTDTDADEDQSHDEKWLYHYMLGKIAEKQKEQPSIFLEHYKKSAKCLFENNATYPFRINHSNPPNLSIEALEVYYRITSSIVKYLEQHSVVKKATGKLFLQILKEVGNSPFALNQAKIDNNSINALKRKMSAANEELPTKRQNNGPTTESDDCPTINLLSSESSPAHNSSKVDDDDITIVDNHPKTPTEDVQPEAQAQSNEISTVAPIDTQARRKSQESNVTSTTCATTTTTGSDSSSSSSSESSSSDSSSDSDSSDDEKNSERPLSDNELEVIYRICIKNLEECVTRFPEHYKSIYRLANIYLNATGKVKDLKKCKQLLIGTYTTGLSNQIQGLFAERKLNNFFNGIWRIPSSEIDRPGSFSTHMSRCIVLLMEVLLRSSEHNILLELALNLNRNPDNDKRYIKEDERKELYQQAISYCIQTFRNQISSMRECPVHKRSDKNLLTLLIDIFRAHQKAIKHLLQKENMFASLLVDGYKVFVEGKLERVPDNVVALDAAVKLCQCEIVLRKNSGKPGAEPATESSFINSLKMFPSLVQLSSGTVSTATSANVTKVDEATTTSAATLQPTSTFAVPPASSTSGISSAMYNSALARPRGRPPGTKNTLPKGLDWSQPKLNPVAMAAMLGIYSNPSIQHSYSNPAQVSALLDDYYKLSAGMSPNTLLSVLEGVNVSGFNAAPKAFNSNIMNKVRKNIAPAVTASSTVISVGSGQLTITPSSYSSTSKPLKSPRLTDTSSTLVHDLAVDLESVIPKSELLTNKIFAEMSGKAKSGVKSQKIGNMAIPKDLPKSLTITPAPAGFSAGFTEKPLASPKPHVTLHPEVKKQKKTHKQSPLIPYASAPSLGPKATPRGYEDVLSGYQKLLLSQMMSRNMVPSTMSKSTSFQSSSIHPKQQSSNKTKPKPAKTMRFPTNSMLPDAQLATMSSNPSLNFHSTALRASQSVNKNQASHLMETSTMKYGVTPMTAHSPNKSPLPPPIARQPSPAMHPASSQKTLQQKLAEQRQKSHQQESKKE